MKKEICPFCGNNKKHKNIINSEKTCKVCNHTFIGKSNALYCSPKCKQKWWRMKD